ncbi:major facilitator transporter [Oceanicola sp. 22II-s10i]|uniref:multidrug effflux MFS transporter n=1 Tax=Oceanicola sp. 22II-s10i TaxID=1317116 RepID=UPI000B524FE3|nr:multidrug effflux MFS transporter [Oceanicola sp. 22II-s10i]OWU84558.1 major facilitator transporter [Oceanicola sp. 22II-s10i]
MLRLAIILGLLGLIGPLAIDMYLPAMPMIATDLGATEAQIQQTLTAYFLTFGMAQLFYGPLADRTGRKLPILLGLAIFGLGSVGATLADSAGSLAFWRAVQGLGGASLMVVTRAVIRDRYTGVEATRLMAMLMLVISVSPMLAPLAGTVVIAFADWRAIFGVLAVLALVNLAVALLALPETLPAERRRALNFGALLRGAKVLLSDPVFVSLTLIGGFGMASFFVFIASASFVYTGQFGLSATGFSLAFAVNAVGFFGASQVAGALGARYGITRVVRAGVWGFFGFTATLALIALAGGATLPVIMAGLFLGNACLGLVIPTAMVLSLDEHGDIAGLASSLGGTLQMLVGGLMITLSGLFFDGTALPMLLAIAVCSTVALTLMLVVFSRRSRATA